MPRAMKPLDHIPTVDEALVGLDRAYHEAAGLASTHLKSWRMSIPADPDRDTDLIICESIRHAQNLIRDLDTKARAAEELLQGLILDPTLPEHLRANAHKVLLANIKVAKHRDVFKESFTSLVEALQLDNPPAHSVPNMVRVMSYIHANLAARLA